MAFTAVFGFCNGAKWRLRSFPAFAALQNGFYDRFWHFVAVQKGVTAVFGILQRCKLVFTAVSGIFRGKGRLPFRKNPYLRRPKDAKGHDTIIEKDQRRDIVLPLPAFPHSPFAFNLITNVIDEKCAYYAYDRIDIVRRQLLQNGAPLGTTGMSVGRATARYGIRKSHGQLLFRLANYFKPKQIVQVGTGMGLSTLYLTGYSAHVQCISLEEDPARAEWARWCLERMGKRHVRVERGGYESLLPKALAQFEAVDFLFFNAPERATELYGMFEKCVGHIQPDTVLVVEGLRASRAMRDFWERVKAHPATVLTFDLYHVGLVFFNKKMYRKDYIVYF